MVQYIGLWVMVYCLVYMGLWVYDMVGLFHVRLLGSTSPKPSEVRNLLLARLVLKGLGGPNTYNGRRGWELDVATCQQLFTVFAQVCWHWLLIALDSIMTDHQDNNNCNKSNSSHSNNKEHSNSQPFLRASFCLAAGVCQKRVVGFQSLDPKTADFWCPVPA